MSKEYTSEDIARVLNRWVLSLAGHDPLHSLDPNGEEFRSAIWFGMRYIWRWCKMFDVNEDIVWDAMYTLVSEQFEIPTEFDASDVAVPGSIGGDLLSAPVRAKRDRFRVDSQWNMTEVLATKNQCDKWEVAARAAGLSVAEWLRRLADAATEPSSRTS